MGQVERNKRSTWVQTFWHLSDLLAIGLGFLLGYWTRFYSPLVLLLPPEKGIPSLSLYLSAALVTAAVWIPLLHAGGLYRLERGRPRHRRADLIRMQALGMLLVAALSFFYRDASFSRVAVPLIWFFTVALTLAGRALVQAAVRRGSYLQPIRFAVVGEGPAAASLVRSFQQSPYPHRFMGTFSVEEDPPGGLSSPFLPGRARPAVGQGGSIRARYAFGAGSPAAASDEAAQVPTLGPVTAIREVALEKHLDLILLAVPSVTPALLQEVYTQCQERDLDFLFVPSLFSFWEHPVRVEEVDGLPVIRLRELSLVGWNGVFKRAFDLIVSVPVMLLLSPLFLALAAAVRLEDGGPIFHRQERVGRDRRAFRMVKFRSMRVNAEAESGPVWASAEDPRRTRVGAFLRKWSLDELPQFWNVLVGQMSLIGPRPERPFFVRRFEGEVADYYDRHRIKSGITGWAQVHGLRGDTPIEVRTRYDLYYVENWSLWLDLRILLLTLRAVVKHRGA